MPELPVEREESTNWIKQAPLHQSSLYLLSCSELWLRWCGKCFLFILFIYFLNWVMHMIKISYLHEHQWTSVDMRSRCFTSSYIGCCVDCRLTVVLVFHSQGNVHERPQREHANPRPLEERGRGHPADHHHVRLYGQPGHQRQHSRATLRDRLLPAGQCSEGQRKGTTCAISLCQRALLLIWICINLPLKVVLW